MSKSERLSIIFDLIVCLTPFFGVIFYFSSDETKKFLIFSVAGIILTVILACLLMVWWLAVKELYEFFKIWRRKNEN